MSHYLQKGKKSALYIGGLLFVFIFSFLGFQENGKAKNEILSGDVAWLFGEKVHAEVPGDGSNRGGGGDMGGTGIGGVGGNGNDDDDGDSDDGDGDGAP